jgi:hypothetical protein
MCEMCVPNVDFVSNRNKFLFLFIVECNYLNFNKIKFDISGLFLTLILIKLLYYNIRNWKIQN